MEPKVSREYDGKLRLLFPVVCCSCPAVVFVPRNQLKRRRYCSLDCKAKSKAGKPVQYGRNNNPLSYRSRALTEYGARCCNCGYAEDERMLDVDHVDGNHKHNALSNLQVLCVWCHALKTRIGDMQKTAIDSCKVA